MNWREQFLLDISNFTNLLMEDRAHTKDQYKVTPAIHYKKHIDPSLDSLKTSIMSHMQKHQENKTISNHTIEYITHHLVRIVDDNQE